MKKAIALALSLLLLTLTACAGNTEAAGKVDSCKVDLGISTLFTEDERQYAVEVIQAKFKEMQGCVLHSLTFAGDERCTQELDSRSGAYQEEPLTAVIAFDSSFRSPKRGGGAWNANEEYTWSWYVGKTEAGNWKLVGYGYA